MSSTTAPSAPSAAPVRVPNPAPTRPRPPWLPLIVSLLAVALLVPGIRGTLHAAASEVRDQVHPAVSVDEEGLSTPLRTAFDRARRAAARDGVEITLTSGWRSAEHQQQLFDEAVSTYGSPDAARQWVLPPADSKHVSGDAIDVGPGAAERTWLEQRGSRWGLCRRYANEPWHFELLTSPGGTCPALEDHAERACDTGA